MLHATCRDCGIRFLSCSDFARLLGDRGYSVGGPDVYCTLCGLEGLPAPPGWRGAVDQFLSNLRGLTGNYDEWLGYCNADRDINVAPIRGSAAFLVDVVREFGELAPGATFAFIPPTWWVKEERGVGWVLEAYRPNGGQGDEVPPPPPAPLAPGQLRCGCNNCEGRAFRAPGREMRAVPPPPAPGGLYGFVEMPQFGLNTTTTTNLPPEEYLRFTGLYRAQAMQAAQENAAQMGRTTITRGPR